MAYENRLRVWVIEISGFEKTEMKFLKIWELQENMWRNWYVGWEIREYVRIGKSRCIKN